MKIRKILKVITILVILILTLQLFAPIKMVIAAENITSTKYQIKDNVIMRVEIGTIVTQFLSNISTSGATCEVYKGNAQVTGDTKMATGMTFKVGDIATYNITVRGDINGDGNLTVVDLSQFKMHTVGINKLEVPYLQAMDINYDGNITAVDISQLKMMLVGLAVPEGVPMDTTNNNDNNDTDLIEGYKLYDSMYYSIQYKNDWPYSVDPEDANDVTFESPDQLGIVNVTAIPNATQDDLSEYLDLLILFMKIGFGLTDDDIIKESTSINGIDAHRVTYKISESMTIIETVVVVNSIMFDITIYESNTNYQDVYNNMVNTLVIKDIQNDSTEQ